MKEEDQSFIERFLDKANPKIAKSNQRFFKQGENNPAKHDILLGISMPTIKEYIKTSPKFELDTIINLAKSEYNEARVLAWALLIRDYSEESIIRPFIQQLASFCGNWNVVDFAAPLCTKALLKIDGMHLVKAIGYSLIHDEIRFNLWSHRFSIIMSLPLVHEGHLNYAIDIVERSIRSEEDLIRKPCGWVLREIRKQNENIFNLFMIDNKKNMSSITKSYALEHCNTEEKEKFK
jgi:3-methyladenine DNA glycosylase AlkD